MKNSETNKVMVNELQFRHIHVLKRLSLTTSKKNFRSNMHFAKCIYDDFMRLAPTSNDCVLAEGLLKKIKNTETFQISAAEVVRESSELRAMS